MVKHPEIQLVWLFVRSDRTGHGPRETSGTGLRRCLIETPQVFSLINHSVNETMEASLVQRASSTDNMNYEPVLRGVNSLWCRRPPPLFRKRNNWFAVVPNPPAPCRQQFGEEFLFSEGGTSFPNIAPARRSAF